VLERALVLSVRGGERLERQTLGLLQRSLCCTRWMPGCGTRLHNFCPAGRLQDADQAYLGRLL